MRRLWRRLWRRHVDTADEARAYLAELEQRDAEIVDLSRKLREAQIRNHFSVMVNDALMRTRKPREN